MPFVIESCQNGVYWIRYSGRVDLPLRLEALQTVEAAARGNPISGNIIDFREAELACSFAEQFRFAQKATDLPEHRGRKAAYLVNNEQSAAIEILELAMSNRGIQTRVFTNPDEAVRWITNGCHRTCETFRMACCSLKDHFDSASRPAFP